LAWLLLVLLVAFAGWRGWAWWQARQHAASVAEADSQQRLSALEERLESLRREQRSQAQRLQQADATNRLLRDAEQHFDLVQAQRLRAVAIGIGQLGDAVFEQRRALAETEEFVAQQAVGRIGLLQALGLVAGAPAGEGDHQHEQQPRQGGAAARGRRSGNRVGGVGHEADEPCGETVARMLPDAPRARFTRRR
jgi:uroporphyrin-3 C-methyltransferase